MPDPVKPDPSISTRAQNAFGIHLITELAGHTPRKNVFLSPTSVFMGLLLAELGASGATGDAIRQTLYVPAKVSSAELRMSASALARQLRSHDSIQLSVANSLWADRRLPLDPRFVAKAAELYHAEPGTLDFSDPAAAETINAWVSQATSNLLDGVVTRDMLARSHCVIANALYFASKWQDPFHVEHTQTRPFFLSDGAQRQVSFLRRPSDRENYRSGPQYEGAVIPYRRGRRLTSAEFGVLLPKPGTTPEEVLANLNVERFFDQRQYVDLDFRMPKFTVNYSASLGPALKEMGMGLAFRHPEADFTPMGSPDFVIDNVLHQSRLALDEEGTVAAAQTIEHVLCGAGRPREQEYERRELVIDRPFALLIRDSSDTILFVGVVYDPKPLEAYMPCL